MGIHAKANRLRDWLWWFAEFYPQRCYVCGKRISAENFLVGSWRDGILLHHINMDRKHTRARLLAPAHRGCNVRFHRRLEKGKDVRTKLAIRFWGATPRRQSTKARVHGAVRKMAVPLPGGGR